MSEGRRWRIGMVSTWRVQCGVAKYTEALCQELNKIVELTVYAEDIWQQEKEEPPIAEGVRTVRCWHRHEEPYDRLYNHIVEDLPDIVHIQYDGAMYSQKAVVKLTDRLHKAGIKTVITLHEVPKFNPTLFVGEWYKNVNSCFITTNKLMDKELKKWFSKAKTTIIPLGSTLFSPVSRMDARNKLKLPHNIFLIVQFGYYGMDKGMEPLIKAIPKILEEIPNAILAFPGGLHPLAPSIHKNYMKQCLKTALKLGLQNKILFPGKLLFGKEIDLWLSAANILVLNHQPIFGTYSASACGHRILCAKRPIIMNADATRLSEFEDGVHCLKAKNEELADKIITLSKNYRLQNRIIKGALKYAQETSFKNIAQKHLEVYKNVGK